MKWNQSVVEIETNAPLDDAFIFIAPISLPSIFTGYAGLPAVIDTKDQTGDWSVVGETRTVVLSDNSTAQERLDGYVRPKSLSYTVSAFTGIMRHLINSANGEWIFSERGDKTHIEWTYQFNPRSVFVYPVIWFVANVLWQRYMQKALKLSKLQLEDSLKTA